MTIVYMIRHAESPYDEGNERTRGLTEKGKADIEKVTQVLIEEGIDVVVSSPYARAVLSVEGIAEHLHLEVATFEDLRERDFAAEDDVIDREDLMSNIRENFDAPDYALKGGESNAQCQRRAIAVLKSILQEYAGKKIAIGTHGLVMTLMLSYFDSGYDFAFLEQLDKPDVYKLRFEEFNLLEATKLISPSKRLP